MTPRVINALLQLKQRRLMGEHAALARVIRVSMNGEDKVFARMVKKLEDESQ